MKNPFAFYIKIVKNYRHCEVRRNLQIEKSPIRKANKHSSEIASYFAMTERRNMQMAFAFYLLALTLLTACRFNPDMQTPGESYLQGEWQQDSVTMQKQLVNYSLYNLKFNCDSFFVQIKTFSKTNTGADSCTQSGQWAEYAKGVYDQRNDTLHVRGLFCNPDYSYKNPAGCFRSGVYEESFKVTKKTDSVVLFNPTSSVISFSARLIKRNTCTLKPL